MIHAPWTKHESRLSAAAALTSMDATAVKAEIKTWEHDFREQHGRTATVNDIKALPHIAEKYKLYKKLVKETHQSERKIKASQTKVLEPPRTPPPLARREQHLPHDVHSAANLHKSRPTASPVNPGSKNPFSPVKKTPFASGKQRANINPFLTPIKVKRTPSPEPFPSVKDELPPVTQQHAAIVKARRRLRGESVSPSPEPRSKRRRANGLDLPAHDRLSPARSVSPVNEHVEEDDSFVDDSPVKAPVGGKTFLPLFEEAIPLSQPTHSRSGDITIPKRTFSRAKTLPSKLFGTTRVVKGIQHGRAGVDTTSDVVDSESVRSVHATKRVNGLGKGIVKEDESKAQKGRRKKGLPEPKGLIPGKDDLFDMPSASASGGIGASRKRSLSNAVEDKDSNKPPGSNRWGLLPPTPPLQQDDGWRYNSKGKGKAKGAVQVKNKKARLSAEQDGDPIDDMSSSDGVDVKVVAWRSHSLEHQERRDSAFTVDPEIQPVHVRPRTIDARARSASPGVEKFEVDLPEEMQRVLAVSTHDDGREREAEYIVKGLIQGRRRRGCQVWRPGEIGGESETSDEGITRGAEDDWEGEGVPWEVGEL